eukprot:6200096-Pleurochrysis_carterae.AAC.1
MLNRKRYIKGIGRPESVLLRFRVDVVNRQRRPLQAHTSKRVSIKDMLIHREGCWQGTGNAYTIQDTADAFVVTMSLGPINLSCSARGKFRM